MTKQVKNPYNAIVITNFNGIIVTHFNDLQQAIDYVENVKDISDKIKIVYRKVEKHGIIIWEKGKKPEAQVY